MQIVCWSCITTWHWNITWIVTTSRSQRILFRFLEIYLAPQVWRVLLAEPAGKALSNWTLKGARLALAWCCMGQHTRELEYAQTDSAHLFGVMWIVGLTHYLPHSPTHPHIHSPTHSLIQLLIQGKFRMLVIKFDENSRWCVYAILTHVSKELW